MAVCLRGRASISAKVCQRGAPPSADLYLGVGEEGVFRNFKIERGGALTNAPRRVVDRAVARAEPAVIFALVTQRDAAKMGANADQDEPFRFLDALGVGLGIAKVGE